ncbi:MAG: flippase [Candidatus Hadarchaeum sp.]|uniref:flippase n=1 Tax=Candidatus Hadarchaeum sp. TaxID=2883567 RepID=UPI003174491F
MPDAREYARRLVRGSSVVFLALIGSQLAALLLRMILARSFSEAEYGLFYSVFFFISFFGLFRELGLSSALAKFIPEFVVKKQYGRIRSSLKIVLGIQAVASALIVLCLTLFSNQLALSFFRTWAAVPLLQILSAWFFVMLFLNFLTVFQGLQRMTVYAALQFLRNFLVVVFAVIFIWFLGFGIEGVALAYLVELSVVVGLAYLLLRMMYPEIFLPSSSGGDLSGSLIRFAIPVFIGGIGGLVLSYMDTLMVQGFLGATDVGFYQVAYPTSHFLWYLPTALVTVLLPMVSEIWTKRGKKLLGKGLEILLKFSFLAILPAVIVFVAFPEIVINILFGPKYLPASATLQVLSLTAVPFTLFMILSYVMQGVGKPIVATKVVLTIAALNFFGNLLLIPTYRILGAAAATLLSYTFGAALLLASSREIIRLRAPFGSILKGLGGGILSFLLILWLKSIIELHPWVELFAVMIPGLVFYAAWLLFTKAIDREDLLLLAHVVPVPKRLLKVAQKIL